MSLQYLPKNTNLYFAKGLIDDALEAIVDKKMKQMQPNSDRSSNNKQLLKNLINQPSI